MIAGGHKQVSADKGTAWANALLCVFILLALGYGVKRVHDAPSIVALFNPEVSVSTRIHSLGDDLLLDRYRFEMNQVTKMIEASFTITNASGATLRDIVISCDYLDRAGNHHGRGKWVIHDTLGPNHQQIFKIQDKRYISHRTRPDSIVCRIVDTADIGGVDTSHDTSGKH